MQNRLTIKDIARLSGVGKSTVSRVMNNEGSVSPQTRERVEAVIRSQGFTPSKSARAMRGQSDKVVAIIVSRLDSPSENQAVRTMLPLLYQQGFDPIVMESQFETRLVEEHLNVLRQRNVDGVILFGFTGLTADMLKPWQEKMVVVAREYPGISSVCYDDEGAVKLLMQRLRKQGHSHISYLGVQESDATTGMRRHQAYLDTCRAQKISPLVALGELNYQSGFQLAANVIEPQTTALVCASDTIALGAMKYLQQQQITPIQVCAIGNTPMLNFLFPETFSVELGYGTAGQQAALQLLGQLSGELSIRQIIIPCKLA
ncbi:TPA: trehalose operon repressor TreR [Serratia fonticola]|jgi:LacI family trehalose operon transcriptional repressor|uniref:HTH-type transcriptional regulator TreR n=1 Tax=Serratia fonticola TaxID=47917 RepID=A0A0F7HAZ3_SERFO|nr:MULTISPECIES: trehalose operon repressor TreR [Serratia]AKG69562.1 trehalose repressor [Serratia fonticola]AYM93249.1 HTH-type transcriptional regulator TreR [Serratia sp. 3ACOL1]MBL5826616.1 HTH-type transcriptional regulator TreR [Serratia fonticola]MBL5863389.1 HTH-type transcriptional regulator TreR [Serratia fonticola]MBL5903954.1 HTH-type transcriptional regulator TreR [Serratia fonticola]